jgi:hypothetical protein
VTEVPARLGAEFPEWIAGQIGIEPSSEARCLKLLEDSGQISADLLLDLR